MKYIVCLIGCCILFGSCAKKSINRKLDGRWQLQEAIRHENGISEEFHYTYYDFQLELMQIIHTQGIEYHQKNKWGRFVYTKDSLHIHIIGGTIENVANDGLTEPTEHFAVEEISNKKMVLNSTHSRLYFRKF